MSVQNYENFTFCWSFKKNYCTFATVKRDFMTEQILHTNPQNNILTTSLLVNMGVLSSAQENKNSVCKINFLRLNNQNRKADKCKHLSAFLRSLSENKV